MTVNLATWLVVANGIQVGMSQAQQSSRLKCDCVAWLDLACCCSPHKLHVVDRSCSRGLSSRTEAIRTHEKAAWSRTMLLYNTTEKSYQWEEWAINGEPNISKFQDTGKRAARCPVPPTKERTTKSPDQGVRDNHWQGWGPPKVCFKSMGFQSSLLPWQKPSHGEKVSSM